VSLLLTVFTAQPLLSTAEVECP